VISSISSAAPSIDAEGDAGALKHQRRIYGRKSGPRLRPARKQALSDGIAALGFELPTTGPIVPETLFAGEHPERFWLEIGFGGGEHLLAQASAHPDVGIIGVEPFVAGVAKLVAGCLEQGVRNVRVLVDDARLLLAALPTGSLERTFVLFPDPWPKTRHHKRRIVDRTTLAELARVTRIGGGLMLATDDRAYARWMLDALLLTPGWAWRAERASDWRSPPMGWVETRYARKALAAGRVPTYFQADRVTTEVGNSALRAREI